MRTDCSFRQGPGDHGPAHPLAAGAADPFRLDHIEHPDLIAATEPWVGPTEVLLRERLAVFGRSLGGHPHHTAADPDVGGGLRGGVHGRLAAGEFGFFWPADPAERGRARRREKTRKPTPRASAGMGRSEGLAGACLMLWELRRGQRAAPPPWLYGWTPDPVAERIVARMDEYAERWHALPDGGSLTVGWTCEPAAWARRPARRTAAQRRR